MLPVHSPFGCPGDYFYCDTNHSVKIIIDPQPNYFNNQIISDREIYDKLILIQGMEPKDLNDISNYVINNCHYFDKILSSFPEVLSSCKNSELFLYASCWILTKEDGTRANHRSEYFNIFNTDKKFKLSHVMSDKNFLPGHMLRHNTKDIILKKREYELFFPNSIPMDKKYELFKDTMFHISIENTKNINYISEKIIDCFMSFTVPIYWGCPNIKDYFNTDGIIFFETIDELNYILDNLNTEEYKKRLPAILENYNVASQNYAFYSDRVNEVINKITKNEIN
jgi:hypothetical protein